jgi:hypothetical protein
LRRKRGSNPDLTDEEPRQEHISIIIAHDMSPVSDSYARKDTLAVFQEKATPQSNIESTPF